MAALPVKLARLDNSEAGLPELFQESIPKLQTKESNSELRQTEAHTVHLSVRLDKLRTGPKSA